MKETTASEVLIKLEESNEENRRKMNEAIHIFREAVYEAIGINRIAEWLNRKIKG